MVSPSSLFFLHRKQPESTELITDEELARHDAARDFMEREEWEESGQGAETYAEALSVLQGLVGEEVSVYGGGGVPWKALIILSGVLLDGHPAEDGPLEDELLVFGVGDGSFMIDRAQLEAPGAVVHYDPFRGLTLTNADGSGLLIMQESRRHA